MTAGYVFKNDIRLIKKELYCNSGIHVISLKFLFIMKIAVFDLICENTWPYHCDKKKIQIHQIKTLFKLLNMMKTAK